jgi:hypothetical protein
MESPQLLLSSCAVTKIAADERGRGGLFRYLAFATVVHAGLFATISPAASHAAMSAGARVVVNALNVDIETLSDRRSPAGGGSPIEGSPTAATAEPELQAAPRQYAAVAIKPVLSLRTARGDRATSPDQERSDEDARPAMAAAQASDARRERGMAAAAAASAGVGPGSGAGPGGEGAGWGAPPIRGNIAFGNGTSGALTGRVCLLPVGTLRIADVLACHYVATMYTDSLDIPERHFSDGFPGVTGRSEWFLIDYTGTFYVSGYGVYAFRLHSDDGSYLYIDDALVIENDGKHAPESRVGSLPLAVGPHRIKVRYAQTDDRMALQLFVRVPGSAREAIFTTHL